MRKVKLRCCRDGGSCSYRFPPEHIFANEKPADTAGFRQTLPIQEIWSGRRGSKPRPRPWQGRALPLSYTRIREIGGDRSPATGRAMPNAAPECNSPREVRLGRNNRKNPRDIKPIRRNWPKPRAGRRLLELFAGTDGAGSPQ